MSETMRVKKCCAIIVRLLSDLKEPQTWDSLYEWAQYEAALASLDYFEKPRQSDFRAAVWWLVGAGVVAWNDDNILELKHIPPQFNHPQKEPGVDY